MFFIWHTLLICFMLIVAFILGYKLGKEKKKNVTDQ
jgi:hypothetical protein